MKKNFIFIEDISIYKKIFLSLLLAASIYFIVVGGYFYGFVLMGIALRFLIQTGVELNLLDMKYRELISWYGIKFGKWKSLPKIDYISVFKTKKGSRLRAGGGNAAYFSTPIFKVNLFYNRNKHITLVSSENEGKMVEIGENISKILNVRLNRPK